MKRSDRHGELAIEVLDVLGNRVVIGHPDQNARGQDDLPMKIR